ncbi:conserved hypothetical protein [Deferribacter desulfuricans SSM1]|uniref:LPS export ABC transporter periplasmic protein LptC n=1 Tax=Deferribacter desulfuricans (strain DSM 14783 / JCM 11476 / NBRC 101012 / SSM1) TaxID=639282 RepID=D3PD38_DEFDS|nr:LPS export ABC transporter periplasmic protein LptC [Deferribacter desulfuricans]BAI80511.1 conserved hypothetical protein [Deferribacter desulfuricans SSM1]
MGKSFRYLLILIVFVVLISFVNSYFKSKIKYKQLNIKKDVISVKQFEMTKRISDFEFYKISAKEAKYYKNNNRVDLVECDLFYKKGDDELKLQSNKCTYYLEEKVILNGKIVGKFNDISLRTIDEAIGVYRVKTKLLEVDGKLVIEDKKGYIKSNKVIYDYNKNVLKFLGNVEVSYEGVI